MFVISRTPLRISFLGGGTDYPAFYKRHRGAVLGTTINQYAHVSVKGLKSSFFDHSFRIAYSQVEHAKTIDDIKHPSIRETLRFKGLEKDLDIHIFSDRPARTGLGSSSACTVSLLNSLYALQGRRVSKQRLAEEACHVEQDLIPENVGSQDQFHAAYGGFNLIEFYPSHASVRPLLLSLQKKAFLEERLLVFYTGLTRFASEVVKEQVAKTEKKVNDTHLLRMLEMVYEGEEILLTHEGEGMVEAFGRLLHESWELKKRLSSSVSTPFIDELYQRARDAGAYGGKLCGAGSGGFLLFFAPLDKHDAIKKALKPLPEDVFRFENEGSSIIYLRE